MIDKAKLENLLSAIIVELEDLESGCNMMRNVAAEARRKIEELDLEDDDE